MSTRLILCVVFVIALLAAACQAAQAKSIKFEPNVAADKIVKTQAVSIADEPLANLTAIFVVASRPSYGRQETLAVKRKRLSYEPIILPVEPNRSIAYVPRK